MPFCDLANQREEGIFFQFTNLMNMGLRQRITMLLHKFIKSGQLDVQSMDIARAYMAFGGITLYKTDKRWDTREKALAFIVKMKEPLYMAEAAALSDEEKQRFHAANEYASVYDPIIETDEQVLAFFISIGIMIPVTDDRYNTPLKAHIFLMMNSIPRD